MFLFCIVRIQVNESIAFNLKENRGKQRLNI